MKKAENPVFVTQATMPPIDKYIEKIRGIWERKWLTNQGVLHQEFQKKLKDFFQSKHVTLCVNGHLGLDLAIKALKLQGEVITTPFTFISTTNALVLNNLTPVFCDINPGDFTIDAEKIEALITERTSAILAVHVYGFPCEIEKLETIAQKHHLKLIFDAAHVFGVEYRNKSIGAYGDISMFSFHATKIFNSIEGGALVYNDGNLEKILDHLKNFGISDAEHISEIGLNAKMNEFQAAMGLCNLDELNFQIGNRAKIASRYTSRLSKAPGIQLPVPNPAVTKSNYAYFPIVINEEMYGHTRDELYDVLASFNYFPRKYFYPLTCDCESFGTRFAKADVPCARKISSRILTLPIYGMLALADVDNICDIIAQTAR